MGISVRDGGIWRESEPHVRDAGIWKPVDKAFVKDAGVWKEAYSAAPPLPTVIGEPFGGGFYFGNITISGVSYALIVADKSSETQLRFKTSDTGTSGTDSLVDGWSNTNSMNNAEHPAAKYCRDYRGGGFDDWYLPARDELYQAWLNIQPAGSSTPANFKTGAAQAYGTDTPYRCSTQASWDGSWVQRFSNGDLFNYAKTGPYIVRPVRRISIT